MATTDEKQIGRRSFLKLTAAGAVLGANWQGTKLALAAADDSVPLGAVTSREKTIEQFPFTLPVRFGDKQAELPVTFRRKGARVFRRNGATWKGRIRVSNGYQEWLDFSRFATGDLAPSGSALGVR